MQDWHNPISGAGTRIHAGSQIQALKVRPAEQYPKSPFGGTFKKFRHPDLWGKFKTAGGGSRSQIRHRHGVLGGGRGCVRVRFSGENKWCPVVRALAGASCPIRTPAPEKRRLSGSFALREIFRGGNGSLIFPSPWQIIHNGTKMSEVEDASVPQREASSRQASLPEPKAAASQPHYIERRWQREQICSAVAQGGTTEATAFTAASGEPAQPAALFGLSSKLGASQN
jgi:hypothetical protein